jgi:hypothetical protein
LPGTLSYWEISEGRREEAIARGFKSRHFFAHRAHYVPKCGPDHLKLAQWMGGHSNPSACREVILYADHPAVDEFPEWLFFDDDLIWHQQQFGRVGQIATANLVLDGTAVYTNALVSDLVQRISHQRAFKTRVETVFHGWTHMLLNAIGNFAVREGATEIYVPTSELAMRHTDRARTVQPALFQRIYDRIVNERFEASRRGDWWRAEVPANAHRLLPQQKHETPLRHEKTICGLHDIERGLGHTDVDPLFARSVVDSAPRHLEEMLRVEKAAGCRMTYSVVGCFLNEVRRRIDDDAHAIAFHSYDHRVDPSPDGDSLSQLRRCREIDYRIKGYRAPRSVIIAELDEASLAYYNFEWLASSASSLGIQAPVLRRAIVKIPILFDDFPLYKRLMAYPEWEQRALRLIDATDFAVFGLHDCYADFWLPHYAGLLQRIEQRGTMKTLDQVAAEVILSRSA